MSSNSFLYLDSVLALSMVGGQSVVGEDSKQTDSQCMFHLEIFYGFLFVLLF